MTTTFRLVFSPGETHTATRVYSREGSGPEEYAGVLTLPKERWVEFVGALQMGTPFLEARPQIEIEPAKPPPVALTTRKPDSAA